MTGDRDGAAGGAPAIVEVAGSIMTVTLNRPDRMNALDHPLLALLASTWEEARSPEIRAVVVTGAGRGFCSGFDVRRDVPRAGDASGLRSRINPHVLGLAALDKPVLAAVNGVAAGAGIALACAADIRIASTAARFVPAYARLGVVPDGGGTYFIPRLVGWSRAFQWLAGSEELPARRALDWGLVDEVVEPDELLERTRQRARDLAAMPGLAVGLTKELLARSWTSTLAEQLEHEAEAQPRALSAPGRAEARAAYLAGLGGMKEDTPP